MMRRSLTFAIIPVSLFGQDAALEHARRVNPERAANMPNFAADEITKRYTLRAGTAEWKYDDTVEAEITAKGAHVSRENLRMNGKPRRPSATGGFMPATGFGAALKPVFDPACPTTLEFAGHEELRGKPVLVYRYRSPANGCFGNLYGNSAYNAARTGRVFIDDSTGEILQFEEEATGLPKGFGFAQRNQVITWDSVKIGDASHWLPVGADFIWRGELRRTTIEYKNYRHFEAATSITFK